LWTSYQPDQHEFTDTRQLDERVPGVEKTMVFKIKILFLFFIVFYGFYGFMVFRFYCFLMVFMVLWFLGFNIES